jgi:Fe-S-cluster containining protein
MQAIADFTKEPLEEVKQLRARKAKGRYTLREKVNGDCVYLGAGKGCTIYEIRPVQCRTWPFWESTVGTPEDWEETKKVCPGSGHGDLISPEEITMRLKQLRL